MPATTISCSTQRHVARQCRVAGMRPAAGIGLALGFLILASVYPAAAQSPNGPIAPQPGLVIPKDPHARGQNIPRRREPGDHAGDRPRRQRAAARRSHAGQTSGCSITARSRKARKLRRGRLAALRGDCGRNEFARGRPAPAAGDAPAGTALFTQTVIGDNGDAAVVGYNDEVDHAFGFHRQRRRHRQGLQHAPGRDFGGKALRRHGARRGHAAQPLGRAAQGSDYGGGGRRTLAAKKKLRRSAAPRTAFERDHLRDRPFDRLSGDQGRAAREARCFRHASGHLRPAAHARHGANARHRKPQHAPAPVPTTWI